MGQTDNHEDVSFDAARQLMVHQQLREKGIRDERVLAAMAATPRELFVRPQDRSSAYDDRALPIELHQTISQPYMVGLMTQWLDSRDHCTVLEIGTGSGYQAAILARLARHVYTLERHAELSRQARNRLQQLGLTNVTCLVGDGSCGWPGFAPYDRIITTAAAPAVPAGLLDQLRDGGKMVIPVGSHDEQVLTLIERQADRFIEVSGIACRFVPLVGEQAWPEAMVPIFGSGGK
jgi:protein-L-isoaspartate(D-aspartate) O-methyltransferase